MHRWDCFANHWTYCLEIKSLETIYLRHCHDHVDNCMCAILSLTQESGF